MNIDEYRALKAQEAESQSDQPNQETQQDENPTPEQTEPTKTETSASETPEDKKPEPTDNETPKTDENPATVSIDGIGDVTLEQIKQWQLGNMRLEDYTRKTQEVASQRKEAAQALELFNYLKVNPHLAQKLVDSEGVAPDARQTIQAATPEGERVSKLEQQLYDMMLQREIEDLSRRYEDFDVVSVLNTASSKNLTSLEDAYKLSVADKPKAAVKAEDKNPAVDEEAIRKQLKAELLKELESERESTQTIISSNDSSPAMQDNEPELTPDEKAVAKKMRLSDAEYIKWMKPK